MSDSFERQSQIVDELIRHWESLLPFLKTPDRAQFLLWLRLNRGDMNVVLHGLVQTAKKARVFGSMDFDRALRYASGCMRNESRERAA